MKWRDPKNSCFSFQFFCCELLLPWFPKPRIPQSGLEPTPALLYQTLSALLGVGLLCCFRRITGRGVENDSEKQDNSISVGSCAFSET